MIIASKQQQQQTKRNERACFYLSLVWVVLVFALFHSCVTELRQLKATKDLLLQMEREHQQEQQQQQIQQQQKIHGSSEDNRMNRVANDDDSNSNNHNNLEIESPASNATTSSLFGILREAANDGLSQITKAVSTGLTDEATTGTTTTKKGHLILHLGPSKTGTTSLQTDLTTAQDQGWLSKDNFHFAGRYYRPYVSNITGQFVINRSESKLLAVARTMFRDGSEDCSDFRRELEAMYNEEHSLRAATANATENDDDDVLSSSSMYTVILSDEAFGNMWLDPGTFSRNNAFGLLLFAVPSCDAQRTHLSHISPIFQPTTRPFAMPSKTTGKSQWSSRIADSSSGC